MPRLYTTSTVAHVIGSNPKWLDNVLSHHSVDGVTSTRQGVSRRISADTVTTLFIAKSIVDALGSPVAVALELATKLRDGSPASLGNGLTLVVAHSTIAAVLDDRVLNAVQAEPPRARGRPPRDRKRVPPVGR